VQWRRPDGRGGQTEQPPGKGGLGFSLTWPGMDNAPSKPGSATDGEPLQAVICDTAGLSWIEAYVYSESLALLGSGEWPCELRAGQITNVTAGSNYTIVVYGLDNNGTEQYQGSTTEVSVVAGVDNDAGEITMTLISSQIQSIDVTPDAPSLAEGGTLQLTAMATLGDGSLLDITDSATWSSADDTVVTVKPANCTAFRRVQPPLLRHRAALPGRKR